MKVIFSFIEHVPSLSGHTNRTSEPTLAELLDPLVRLPVSEFIFLVRQKADQIQSYMAANHSHIPISFIQQTAEKGLGHTVSLASDYVSEEPVLIVGGDVMLDLDWTSFSRSQYSTIAVRRIIDERPYGLVELREGIVGCLIEKPRRTDLAIAGCYFIRESKLLFECLHNLIQTGRQKNGGYQLTDALQQMIEQGVEMQVQEVELAEQGNPYALDNFFSPQLESLNGALQSSTR
ncbi:MAG: sugar phosphate nucleotidyltransferase [Candidatus Poribacteria bacterium]|nr:sugar phosphate nucleotidyltransferase [Candidatus Poribacteria bacterium]